MNPRTVLSLGRLDRSCCPTEIFVVSGSCLPQGRIKLVSHARAWDATHILWIDSDMTFPPDTLRRLLSHEVRVVGINYMGRRDRLPTSYMTKSDYYWMVESDQELRKVYHVATGLLLTDITVFDEIPHPYFNFEPLAVNWKGDDEYFTDRLREAGIDIYCDAKLSHECGHVGEVLFLPVEGKIAL